MGQNEVVSFILLLYIEAKDIHKNKNFAKFIWKHLYQSLFFAGDTCNFIKKETLAQVLSCEFCGIFQKNSFIEYLRWLLLSI